MEYVQNQEAIENSTMIRLFYPGRFPYKRAHLFGSADSAFIRLLFLSIYLSNILVCILFYDKKRVLTFNYCNYGGNLDEKVSERVLYEILIQAGCVVDLYIPRDKETNRSKRYAFAEYESEEIAHYAVRLFSGLVCLHNRTLRFAISGQDKPSGNPSISAPKLNSLPIRTVETQETQMSAVN